METAISNIKNVPGINVQIVETAPNCFQVNAEVGRQVSSITPENPIPFKLNGSDCLCVGVEIREGEESESGEPGSMSLYVNYRDADGQECCLVAEPPKDGGNRWNRNMPDDLAEWAALNALCNDALREYRAKFH